MNNIRPSDDKLIDILFEDMKKMDSVNRKLQREISDLRVKLENMPDDMKMMESHIKKLTREMNEIRNQMRNTREDSRLESHLIERR